jgi:hypothetical protein
MKRYWVFGYDRYYPSGGMSDFKKSFTNEVEAYKFADELKETMDYDYIEVEDIMSYC